MNDTCIEALSTMNADILRKIFNDVSDLEISRDDKDLLVISLCTSLSASCIGTIAANPNGSGGAMSSVTHLFGMLMRGIAEALATYETPVGHTTMHMEKRKP